MGCFVPLYLKYAYVYAIPKHERDMRLTVAPMSADARAFTAWRTLGLVDF